jgi:cell division FtsZ-interacting protein ZapD|tara:strand:- start:296 stop:535 length:240 start_codon:yes stop_codon:yes gene_type:complete
MAKENKTLRVLNHLKQNRTITSWEAITQYRATRLSAIILNLKQQGHNIITEMEKGQDGVRYARYHFITGEPNADSNAPQ